MMKLVVITIITIIITTCCTVVIAMRLLANGNIGNQLKIHLQKEISISITEMMQAMLDMTVDDDCMG